MKYNVKIAKKEEKPVYISTDTIELDSALKLCGAVTTGGIAKMLIQDGKIKVNGEVCLMRKKKLHRGDKFQYEKTVYAVTGE